MNRTDTAPRVLAMLGEEKTVRQVREALGITHMCARQALQRLLNKGKVAKRRDEEGEVWWRATA